MTALDLDAIERRYEAALDAKPGKGAITKVEALTDSVADVPELVDAIRRTQVTTVAELEALPGDTAGIDLSGEPWAARGDGFWWSARRSGAWNSRDIALPLTIVWQPS